MKLITRLALLFLVAVVFAIAYPRLAYAACPERPDGPTPCPTQRPGAPRPGAPAAPRPTTTATELVRPEQGNDTLKLASLGVVFLIIGAAVVYAPQIVSGITSLPRRAFGRGPRKPSAPPKRAPEPPQLQDLRPPPVTIEAPLPSAPVVVPLERAPIRVGEPDDVVARLQSEVRSAWSKTR